MKRLEVERLLPKKHLLAVLYKCDDKCPPSKRILVWESVFPKLGIKLHTKSFNELYKLLKNVHSICYTAYRA